MTPISRRLSIPELSQRILDMAKTGVYRESVFEALQSLATKKQIGVAIAQAKQLGLHSVASLRDEELGTYYEVDLVKYQSLKEARRTSIPLDENGDLVKQITEMASTIRIMVLVTGGMALGLGGITLLCFLSGHPHWGIETAVSLICVTGLWAFQRALAKTFTGL